MSKFTLNPEGSVLEIGGIECRFIFNFKTINKVQESFGKPCNEVINDLFEPGKDTVTGSQLLEILCDNEKVTREFIDEHVSTRNFQKIVKTIIQEWSSDLPDPEDIDPNSQSGETED